MSTLLHRSRRVLMMLIWRISYPYISHVICNAGVAPFLSINWFHLARQLATNFMGALTYPRYNIQEKGLMSDDGLGWVWQCNVFGHYVLVRPLNDSLLSLV